MTFMCNLESLSLMTKESLSLLYTVQVINFGLTSLVLLRLRYILAVIYTLVHPQLHIYMFVKDLGKCHVEALQHGNAPLANNVVDNFRW